MNKDIERLLELFDEIGNDSSICNCGGCKEYEQLKSKLNEKLEKYDTLNEVFENYPKGWLDMKQDLETQLEQANKALDEIKIWYGCNQDQVNSETALKMIKILKELEGKQ